MHLDEIKDLLIQVEYGPNRTHEAMDRINEIEYILYKCAKILKVKPLEVGSKLMQLLEEQNSLLKS